MRGQDLLGELGQSPGALGHDGQSPIPQVLSFLVGTRGS